MAAGFATLAAGLVVGAGRPAAAETTACGVAYSVTGQWSGGFTAEVAVHNLGGDAVDGWRLSWEWPSGQRVDHAWNAEVTTSGTQATAANAGYNAAIAANGTVTFGFRGSWTGANTAPTSFALNGVRCADAKAPTAAQQVAAMQPGWNLGNTLDSTGSDETSWGNPRITKSLLDNVKAQGFKSVRLPVTWSAHTGPAPDYTIEPAYLDRVKEVVGWALQDDLYVMVNLHHDSWQWIWNMPGDRAGVLARYNALWTQIAAAVKDFGPKLVLESVNEPQFTGSTGVDQEEQLLHELNASFRDIVRGSGSGNATRLLVLPTLHTSGDQAHLDALANSFRAFNDPYLVATIHNYGYWPFSVNVAGGTRFDATVQKDLTDTFDRAYNTFVSRGIPVIVGEYGLLGFDRHTGTIEQGEKLKFFEYFGYYARTKKLTTMLWDNGQHFDRTAYTWRDPELFAQIKSSWTTRSGTAYSDLIFSAKSTPVTAKTLTLNLNGTRFQGLRQGTTDLVQGRDYTVSGDQLTLTAALITRLSGAREYGTNAVLHARFSQGVPWRINLVTRDTPILSNATGTTSSFAIPTTFRGDQLATMEAKYDDGTNAGPHNWTSFKEFDRTFAPNYTAGTTTLTSDFFAEIQDNARVTLTFHYWSGEKLTYYITKSGTEVTGTTA
ncbi:cellulase family glycosylhydrolase [Saccharothrix variisporea]|uniref:cellulase family glycosylhydrolase n=1 Tax=Saccharothrix variisporea TaxID=543527 RepID=UPI001FE3D963|nr:cellulase family glycosylhydrolase [Saccharothrix variisporea]